VFVKKKSIPLFYQISLW